MGRYWGGGDDTAARDCWGAPLHAEWAVSVGFSAPAHTCWRGRQLSVRACTIVNWTFIGDVRCDSLISAVRNECGVSQWELPMSELRMLKVGPFMVAVTSASAAAVLLGSCTEEAAAVLL